jgi:cytoskeletal protein CcmA (bactofilin family)
MWNKRDDEPGGRPASSITPVTAAPGEPRAEHGAAAAIGPSISIMGDLTGDEDLTILGKVEGKVDVPQHSVTIGRSGRVKADIHAKVVSVEGEVRGNLLAGEQILIRKTATMLGNLTAPRVGLEDGCRFKGTVDMEAQGADKPRAPLQPAPRAIGALETSGKPADAAKPM